MGTFLKSFDTPKPRHCLPGRIRAKSPVVFSACCHDHATRNTQHAIRPTPATINLHIDHLILHGFPPGDRARLGRAVEQELARLLAEGGLPPVLAKGGTLARLDGGQFSIAAGAPVDQIGAQIAQVLYRSLG